MARNHNHYIITIEVAETYTVEVDAPSEEKAIKIAEKSVKNNELDPDERVIDTVDVFETPDDSDIED